MSALQVTTFGWLGLHLRGYLRRPGQRTTTSSSPPYEGVVHRVSEGKGACYLRRPNGRSIFGADSCYQLRLLPASQAGTDLHHVNGRSEPSAAEDNLCIKRWEQGEICAISLHP